MAEGKKMHRVCLVRASGLRLVKRPKAPKREAPTASVLQHVPVRHGRTTQRSYLHAAPRLEQARKPRSQQPGVARKDGVPAVVTGHATPLPHLAALPACLLALAVPLALTTAAAGSSALSKAALSLAARTTAVPPTLTSAAAHTAAAQPSAVIPAAAAARPLPPRLRAQQPAQVVASVLHRQSAANVQRQDATGRPFKRALGTAAWRPSRRRQLTSHCLPLCPILSCLGSTRGRKVGVARLDGHATRKATRLLAPN